MADESRGLLERHFQTFLLGLVSLGIVWVGNSSISNGKELITVSGRLTAMENSVSEKMLDRYTGSDARGHIKYEELKFRNMSNTVDENKQRIIELEERLNGDYE